MTSIQGVNEALGRVVSFLTPLMPLVRCHMVDYITLKHFDTLLPPHIQRDLITLPRNSLLSLPSASLQNDTADVSSEGEMPWDWSSSDLPSFMTQVRRMCPAALGVTTHIDKVLSEYGSEEISVLSMKGIMSPKKTHEVEVMSQVIARLAKGLDVSWLVDLGSGRGYLSSSLVLQYGQKVVAIDSSSSNTSSALERNAKMKRMLDNLTKRLKEEEEGGRPVRRGKTRRRKVATQEQPEEAAKLGGGGGLTRRPKTCFYGVTKYIREDTDLLELVRDAVEAEMRCEGEEEEKEAGSERCSDVIDKAERLDTNTETHTAKQDTRDIGQRVDTRDIGQRIDMVDESYTIPPTNTHTHITTSLPPNTHTINTTKHDTRDIGQRVDMVDESYTIPPTNTHTHNTHPHNPHPHNPLPTNTHPHNTPSTYTHQHNPRKQTHTPPPPPPHEETNDTNCIVVNKTSHLGLIGLHTCGNLASSSLSLFATNPRVKFLCNVGCCYHLLEEEFSRNTYNQMKPQDLLIRERADDKNESDMLFKEEESGNELKNGTESLFKESESRSPSESNNNNSDTKDSQTKVNTGMGIEEADPDPLHPSLIPNLNYGFPLCSYLRQRRFAIGRNARMLSSQAVDRLTQGTIGESDALYWRALLQVVLKDKLKDISDLPHVGRLSAKCQTFTQYTRAAMIKLGVSFDVTDEELEEYDRLYRCNKDRLERFFLLRASLAAVVEGLMLLDRLAFLCEQEEDDVSPYLVPLFDPVTSPRCYALIAIRNTHTH